MACSMPPMYWSTAASNWRAHRPRASWSGQAQRAIPRGLTKCHRVVSRWRLAAGRPSPVEIGILAGVAGAVGHQVLRQSHRQLLVGDRHVAAGRAVHDRDRTGPVALARDASRAAATAPVFLQVLFFQISPRRLPRRPGSPSVVFPGIDATHRRVLRPPRRRTVSRAGAGSPASPAGRTCARTVVALIVRRHPSRPSP